MSKVFETLFEYGFSNRASDIHLTEGSMPVFRIDGKLNKVRANSIISRTLIEDIIRECAFDVDSDIAVANKWSDKEFAEKKQECVYEFLKILKDTNYLDMSFRYVTKSGEIIRFRANFYISSKKLACALRMIPCKIPNLSDLDLPKAVGGILQLTKGLVLVTGATGSGKSTTIAAIINEINKTKDRHILTIEDPIEFVYTEEKCLIHQRELGMDVLSFGDAIKCALREDPDIVVLGEIRNHESISAALTLAETGHLVFATLHTKSAAESIGRIIDVFPPEQQAQIRAQLAGGLEYVISQTLLPKSTGKGRVALLELMKMTSGIRGNITANGPISAITDDMRGNSIKLGTQTFEQCAQRLLDNKMVDFEHLKQYLEGK